MLIRNQCSWSTNIPTERSSYRDEEWDCFEYLAAIHLFIYLFILHYWRVHNRVMYAGSRTYLLIWVCRQPIDTPARLSLDYGITQGYRFIRNQPDTVPIPNCRELISLTWWSRTEADASWLLKGLECGSFIVSRPISNSGYVIYFQSWGEIVNSGDVMGGGDKRKDPDIDGGYAWFILAGNSKLWI